MVYSRHLSINQDKLFQKPQPVTTAFKEHMPNDQDNADSEDVQTPDSAFVRNEGSLKQDQSPGQASSDNSPLTMQMHDQPAEG